MRPQATASYLHGNGLADKVLVGGVIDGHNIRRGDLSAAFGTLEALGQFGAAAVSASTSTSLLHVPHDVTDESALDERLVSWLAFADQKVEQVVALARGLADGRSATREALDAASAALDDRRSAPGVRDGAVRTRALAEGDFSRVEEIESLLRRAVDEIPTRQLWVNPDCGLKTRGYDETTASLRNIVDATRRVREDVAVAV